MILFLTYKYEVWIPVPKSFPFKSTSDIQNISGLLTFDKIMEKLMAELMGSDMIPKDDRA